MSIVAAIFSCTAATYLAAADGGQVYRVHCAMCHGAEGEGGERGAEIASRVAARSESDLRALVRDGIPGAGMPGAELMADEQTALIAHLHSLRARGSAPRRSPVEGFPGIVKNGANNDLQLIGDDGQIHLLRQIRKQWRELEGGTNWLTYNGSQSGNRHSELREISPENVAGLRVAWLYAMPGAQRLETTPVVANGVMYVTNVNEVHALDSGTGRLIWQYRRPRSKGLAGDAAGGINRGVALAGDRVFLATDNAHLLALNRFNGALLWETEMANSRQNYGATAAPLVIPQKSGDLVVSGTSGGDEGVRGFLAAYRASDGAEAWRFWTVPAKGEPGSETWKGNAIEHGCATTWLTGSFDPTLDLLYWTTGNPCPDYDGSERVGDNLYSNSVLALRPRTGELAWYFQYTPHDLHDWDSVQTPLLIDIPWQGVRRRVLAQANRNGYFYLLDRASGEFLHATRFVEKLTWAREIDSAGRPIVNPNAAPTPDGVRVCPSVDGATNWFAPSFDPASGLFLVQSLEKCSLFRKAAGEWSPGKSFYNGSASTPREEHGEKVLRAIDVISGEIRWERRQAGTADTWGGVLSTASGLAFYCDDSGDFNAVRAKDGSLLWSFPANARWKASPMAYSLGGREFVAVAAGGSVIAFSLGEHE